MKTNAILDSIHTRERLDHFRPQIAREQRQYILAADLRAQRHRFRGEQPIEGLDIDFGALEFRPGVFQMIGGVGAPDDVGGQSALGLIPCKRLERRGGQHAAEIPDHCLDHHALPETNASASG